MPHRPAAGSITLRFLGSLDIRNVDGEAVHAISRQPKGVGLLAYLALTPRMTRSRDVLLGLFWPELDEQHARNALSQTLHRLRTTLGAGVLLNRGEQDLYLAADRIACDAVTFGELHAAGKHGEALAIYRGDLLDGFYIRGAAPEWDDWLETKRRELRQNAIAAAWALSNAASAEGNPAGAAHWGRRALALAPVDEPGLRRLLRVLSDAGDRSGALDVYDDFLRVLRETYELEPEAESEALVAELRAQTEAAERPRVTLPAAAQDAHIAVDSAPPARKLSLLRRARVPLAAVALGIVMLATVRTTLRPEVKRVLAVGRVDSGLQPDTIGPLRFLLSTTLSRAPELSVVSDERIRELLMYAQSEGRSSAEMRKAARAAGATEIIEGVVTRGPRDQLRLDVQRIDLATGTIRSAYTAESTQLLELVDVIGEKLAKDLGARPGSIRAGATTASLHAYVLYEQGLRSYYASDREGAARLFEAALQQDSTFAMAAYYASRSIGWPESMKYMERAKRLADRASERERLLIQAEWAMDMMEPERLTLAQALADRFPMEPDGPLLYGQALIWAGDFLGAVPHLRRAVQLDSLSLSGRTLRCRACDALRFIRTAYALADSFPAAERIARDWIRLQPRSADAWSNLVATLEATGRYPEALAALRAAAAFRTPGYTLASGIWMRQGRFEEVDAAFKELFETGDAQARLESLWAQTISFRMQGRLQEALSAARSYRQISAELSGVRPSKPDAGLLEAIVRFEMGDARGAGALFDSIAALVIAPSTARNARARAWNLTHVAAAYADLRDTTRLRVLEDTIRIVGARSAYARDQRLHHYVRGLRYRIAGRNAEAATAFRQATFSLVEGHVRVNLELARTLLDLRRPHEAIPVLRSALSGPLSASGLYATRSELQELMGYAFMATHQPDSAVLYFSQAAHAWKRGDPSFQARRSDLLTKTQQLKAKGE